MGPHVFIKKLNIRLSCFDHAVIDAYCEFIERAARANDITHGGRYVSLEGIETS